MKLQFQSYILDLPEKNLFQNGVEIYIEPKVMEVLIYLIENRDRYINIEELHENVWQDRIVSDSAIRRTIVKLRRQFQLTSPTIEFIRTRPKKGYIWNVNCSEFCEPVASSTNQLRFELIKSQMQGFQSQAVDLVRRLLRAG